MNKTKVYLLILFFIAAGVIAVSVRKHPLTSFAENLTAGDFDKAFEYVSYFDQSSDLTPEISYEEAKNIWTERVKELRDEGVYIKSFDDYRIVMDDGYPVCRRAKLTVVNGEQQISTEANIALFRSDGKWKVQHISFYEGLKELEEALSGYVGTR